MSSSFERYQKRRLRSSYFSVVISIALVLFMVGVLGILVLKSTKIADHFKNQVSISLFLKDHVERAQSLKLEESLKKKDYINTVSYVSKEMAAETFSQDIGEDFLDFLGTNPLKNSMDLHLKAEFVNPVMMLMIQKELLENTYVSEVVYDAPLVELLTQNIQKISFWILVVAGFFMLLAIILINSSLRLSIYSKRFTIKTMQMVGATKRFIRRPFIWKSIRLGIVGAFLGSLALYFLVYYISEQLPELDLLTDIEALGIVFGGLFLLGIFISWISTFFATQRFLNLKTNYLY